MANEYRSDSDKDPRELEREVDQQRAHLEDTITALAQRFVPSQWLDQIVNYTRQSGGGDLTRNLMETVRANPIPTLLTATGITWLLMGPNRRPPSYESSRYEDYGSAEEPSSASYGVDTAYDPHAGEGHHELGTSDRLRHMSESARHMASRSRHQSQAGFERLLREQPLAIGVMGIALGALLGASMPTSRREDEMLSPYRERFNEKASEFADRAATKVDEVGRHVADRVDPNTKH